MELSWAPSDRGELTLLQLIDGITGRRIHEIRLDGELVASSETSDREREHIKHALDALSGSGWDVVVCGLGLGFAACAVLDDDRVRSLLILEPEEALVDWCRARLLPTAERILADPRAQLVTGDLIASITSERMDPHGGEGQRVDALVVNVAALADESDPTVSGWERAGAADLTRVLRPGGVLALWSDVVATTVVSSATRPVVQQVVIGPGSHTALRGDPTPSL